MAFIDVWEDLDVQNAQNRQDDLVCHATIEINYVRGKDGATYAKYLGELYRAHEFISHLSGCEIISLYDIERRAPDGRLVFDSGFAEVKLGQRTGRRWDAPAGAACSLRCVDGIGPTMRIFRNGHVEDIPLI